jgi:TetR/AcrR family transcriptional regulator, transcriptional repressor for nem operon
VARTKEFDPDVVLVRAMELFWANGYEATSMAQLVEHLGIARASIYGTFGSKHDLYLRALDRYIAEKDPAVVDLLARPGPVLPSIRALVRRYAHDGERGCLVVSAAVERLPGDGEAARRVEASWSTLHAALIDALTRAKAQGELPAGSDVDGLAAHLLVVLQGLKVLSKTDAEPARRRAAAEHALSILE